jgi:hypothetical protein
MLLRQRFKTDGTSEQGFKTEDFNIRKFRVYEPGPSQGAPSWALTDDIYVRETIMVENIREKRIL